MRLVVLPGDGIGPEITAASLSVLQAAAKRAGLPLELDEDVAGHASYARYGTTIRPELLDRVRAADGLVLGPLATFEFTDEAKGGINPSKYFRKSLDLFANIRPGAVLSWAAIAAPARPGGGAGKTPRVSTPTATWRSAAPSCR